VGCGSGEWGDEARWVCGGWDGETEEWEGRGEAKAQCLGAMAERPAFREGSRWRVDVVSMMPVVPIVAMVAMWGAHARSPSRASRVWAGPL
jgi:hypothetical protein